MGRYDARSMDGIVGYILKRLGVITMAKNYMAEVAKMLGVELGEEFHIKNSKNWIYRLNLQGLETKCQENEWLECNLLLKLLNGELEIVKLPWKPKIDEQWYFPDIISKRIVWNRWEDDTRDYAMLTLGICYRTKEEAEAHLAEDYKKLTGKELGK